MAKRLTSAQRRYIENALLIAALSLIFKKLSKRYTSKQLGDVAETTSGGTPLRGTSNFYEGDIPWIKSGELNDGIISDVEEFITQEGLQNSSAKIFPKGTLVVALYGATVGKTGILGLDAASNQAVCAVFPKINIVSTEFLFWFLRYKRPEFLGSSFGGAQPNISQKLLRATEISVPSLNLQEAICNFLKVVERRQNGDTSIEYPALPDELADVLRIVSRIEALAARVVEAQALRREASEEAEVICVSARNDIFGKLQTTITPIRFDEAAEMRLGKMLSTASKVSATPLPYLRNANIQWDRLDLSSVYEMDFNESEKLTFRLKAGDILVCEGGDIGKSAIWNDELLECYYQKALHRIRVNTNLTFPRFILHHIFWAAEQNHFLEIKTQTTIPHLTGVKLKAYKIYLPSLEEQRRLVAYPLCHNV